jgi:hypothetical protein
MLDLPMIIEELLEFPPVIVTRILLSVKKKESLNSQLSEFIPLCQFPLLTSKEKLQLKIFSTKLLVTCR